MNERIFNDGCKLLLAFMTVALLLAPGAAMAYTEHSGTIGSETWAAGTHYVTSNLIVSDNETLNIDPCTVVKFAPGAQMAIHGTLIAAGTESCTIVFTSRDDDTHGEIIMDSDGAPAPGDWDGIYLFGSSTNDGIGEFDYCLIRYGGYSVGGVYANVSFYYSDSGHFTNSVSEHSGRDGILIHNCSPIISSSTVANSAQHGLSASYGGAPVITGNTFTDNAQYGIVLYQPTISANISGNTGSGNSLEGLVLLGNVSTDQTWSSDPDTPIVLPGNVNVSDDVTLTIAPGTIVKFGPGIQLLVNGTLDANGSAEERVVFTSLKDDDYGGDTNNDDSDSTPAPGDWDGIFLYGSGDNDGIGEFDYCLIRYGGNAGGPHANVYCQESDSGHFINSVSEYSSTDGIRIYNCSPTISSSTVANSTQHGLYASNGGAPTITGNIFTDNGQYPAYFHQTAISNVYGNTASGNAIDGMVLSGTVAVNQTWSMTGTHPLPIVLIGNIGVSDNVTLTIAPGTVVKFGPGMRLTVNGILDANGTAEKRVVFTSLKDDDYGDDTNNDGSDSTPAPGDWNGIFLYGNGDNDGIGEFDYCLIRYGGYANVSFDYSDSGHFTNSVNEYSGTDGIRIQNCDPAIVNSVVSNNTRHGLTFASGDPLVTNCIFWGNGSDEIFGTPVVTWSDIQGGYEGEGNIDADPRFMDATAGDYHLDICSPAIDAGDPVELLAADYTAGETHLSVNRVTGVDAGDVIWITDGTNTENGEVINANEDTIVISSSFANSYSVADLAYLYTARSGYSGEPAPNGRRINMGAWGGGGQATPSTVCKADFDGDLDVDGLDLAVLAAAMGSSVGDGNYDPRADLNEDGFVDVNDMALFAEQFGGIDCPPCP